MPAPRYDAMGRDALIGRIPPVRGTLTPDAQIARFTWFRVGGPAEILFEPADSEDLASFLTALSDDIPVTIIGVGSNLLVRDGGIPGITIRLGRAFAGIAIENDIVTAAGGAVDVTVSRAARDAGLGGLEFLSGIPGTIGGAIRMNAGAYGREIQDVLIDATAVDRQGALHDVPLASFEYSYRHSAAPQDWIFLSARLQAAHNDKDAVTARMEQIAASREDSQPIRTRTGGSTFKNPPNAKAWELIDAAGCRGLTRGGAQVSNQHCNFLINTGEATADDLEGLGEDVRRRVKETTGVELEWEIRRIGVSGRPTEGRAS
jgi:UDP-N-acetylmuramate dehydrogenase